MATAVQLPAPVLQKRRDVQEERSPPSFSAGPLITPTTPNASQEIAEKMGDEDAVSVPVESSIVQTPSQVFHSIVIIHCLILIFIFIFRLKLL